MSALRRSVGCLPYRPLYATEGNICTRFSILTCQARVIVSSIATEFLEVIPNGEARKRFGETVARFHREGVGATPMVFGNHRKPEGVMRSFSLFEELLPAIAEIHLALLVRERLDAWSPPVPSRNSVSHARTSSSRWPPPVGTYLPEFRQDLLELEDSNLQRRLLTIWTDVSKGLMAGIPLAHLASVGGLSDCYEIYFDVQDATAPRYRFVHRLLPKRVEAVSVEAIAAGERRARRVRVAAARRLGRLNDDHQ